jgi:hypothetical protein
MVLSDGATKLRTDISGNHGRLKNHDGQTPKGHDHILRWCGRWESNPHSSRNGILNPARLPIPPRPHAACL